ncbi:MAG: hypothetical protein JXB45_09275, partial [Candidatus Krumholzibacteriota bacterium]|nr:hypothetical protein [Candidatus Krumholzibacteriota bacterium]
ASPGTYGMKNAGVVLGGSPDILSALPDFPPSAIPRREAVILLENRIMSLLHCFPAREPEDEIERYRFFYQIARTYTDILAVSLCMTGDYRPGYRERWNFVSRDGGEDKHSLLRDERLRKNIRLGTVFKLNPRLDLYGASTASCRDRWLETARDAVTTWRKCETIRRGGAGEKSPLPSLSSLLERRQGGGGRSVDRLRAWKRMLEGYPLPQRIILIAKLRGKLGRIFPLEYVREQALRLLEELPAAGGPGQERGGEAAPFPSPRWMAAAREWASLWSEMVFGRKEG